jgi:hypothetical protein
VPEGMNGRWKRMENQKLKELNDNWLEEVTITEIQVKLKSCKLTSKELVFCIYIESPFMIRKLILS